ncbi:transcription elongation factor GreA [Candidatus Berkelbacteria bacterium]|nr:transcription elongation factor GreA [Candidatus Berkelbacteria bacterium]
MIMKSVVISPAGLDKLKQELRHHKEVRRPDVISRIAQAREYGDLSENAEYEDARNEQSFIEGRIQELEDMIKHAQVVAKASGNGHTTIGSTVKVKLNGKSMTFMLVGSQEADPTNGKISIESPIGKALLNQKAGETVEVEVPAGKTRYQILSIS